MKPDAKEKKKKKGKGEGEVLRVRTETVLNSLSQQMKLHVDCIQQHQAGEGMDWISVIKPEIRGILYQEEP